MLLQQSSLKWLVLLLAVGTFFVLMANAPYVQAQSSAQLLVLQSDTNRIVLELSISGYDSRPVTVGGTTYTALAIPDLARTSEAGKPQLPIKGAMVGIPPGAQASLKIVADDSSMVPLARPPLPVPTPQIDSDPTRTLPRVRGQSFTPNAAAYSSNQFYPADAAKIAETGNWRSQRFARVEFHPLQYNPATRQLVFHRRLRVEIALSYPRGQSPATIGGSLNEGAFEKVFEKAFVNYSSAKNWRARPATTQLPRTRSRPSSAGPWYKIGADTDGIYKVLCNQLTGISLPVDPSTIQVFKQGTELTISVGGAWGLSCTSNDYIEFFGQAPNSKYTNTNIYWLTYGAAAGKRMTTRDGSGTGTLATTITKTVLLEQNVLYRPAVPMLEGADHWYWTLFYTPNPIFPSVNQADYPFSLDAPATGSFSATMQIVMQSVTSGSHQTVASMNSTQITDTTWSGSGEHISTILFPQSLMTTSNTIHLSQPSANSGSIDYLNYFTLTYQSAFTATSDVFRFQQPVSNTWQYQINNFSGSTIETFDITDPYNVVVISPTVVTGPPYTLQFADAVTNTHEYIALTTAQRKTPSSVVLDTPSNLKGTNAADYIIISHSSFTLTIQPLVTLRNSQFARPVQVVDVQDIYDEFSDGLVDAQAIRDFLQYAYASWTVPAPSYVLLVGGGIFDPKGYCITSCNLGTGSAISTSVNSTLIPPYLRMVDPYIGETVSDNQLVAFNSGNNLPNMFIGRLPADTLADVTALVIKIVNYENPPAGLWRSTSAFVADNAYSADGSPDGGGNFWFFSDQIAGNPTYYPTSLNAQRIYYNPCTDTISYHQCALPYPSYSTFTATHSAIISAINSGRIIVNYIGHGAYSRWANENLFEVSDLPSLTNGNKTPVMLELTCNTGYFIYPEPSDPTARSLAKHNVNLPNNGAVASWAAVGQGLVTGHDLLEKGFFDAVMNQNMRQLGPAVSAGKANLYSSGENLDLIDTTLLLGDPASRLPIQFLLRLYLPLIFR